VAHYPLNGDAKDVSGNGLEGTVTNCRFVDVGFGNSNKAAEFSGESWIELPETEKFKFGAGDFTYCAWVNTSHVTGGNRLTATIIAEDQNGATMRGLYFEVHKKGEVESPDVTLIARDGDYVGARPEVENKIADSKWHQVVGIRAGSRFSLAIDGDIVAIVYAKVASTDAGCRVRIGARIRDFPKHNPYVGLIDNVRIYNRALSAEEVKALYDLEKPKSK